MPVAEREKKCEKQDERSGQKQCLRQDRELGLPHELQTVRDIVQREDDKDMHHHIGQAVGPLVAVDDMVVEHAVA